MKLVLTESSLRAYVSANSRHHRPALADKLDSWSPMHELVQQVPLRYINATSVDMAYSATLTNRRELEALAPADPLPSIQPVHVSSSVR